MCDGRYVDPPTAVPTAEASGCERALQLRAASFPFPDSSCSIQLQESTFNDIQQQFGDMMLPSNGYSGNNNNNNNSTGGGGGYNASLPPPPTFPLPWCHGLSSDADYYGPGMDHSYSPQDSFSSSSSSCYDSPTRMEPSYHGVTSDHYHYQHCNRQDCHCLSHCWPAQQESFSAPEYAPYYNPTDYAYPCPVEDSYFRRDLQMSSEMCYNVL
ncbi:colorectal cancer-associated protein 2 [Morone saxatilis]|uniref:colorectal cancer-associated protein 2 n=1 Tax=Morone saxatilis TaxID=34816 RepID=UPI0015E23F75|nr:colorectal cancer-associated protein 2 [Morone saxatilis]